MFSHKPKTINKLHNIASQKDSWVLHSRIVHVVIFPLYDLQVIKVVLQSQYDGCPETPTSQICNFFQTPKFKTPVLWALQSYLPQTWYIDSLIYWL